jgi:uncharacterized DUF497 family protein
LSGTATVFDDVLSATFPDRDHSSAEQRFLTIGQSAQGRVLVVSQTEEDARIRLTSGRGHAAGA